MPQISDALEKRVAEIETISDLIQDLEGFLFSSETKVLIHFPTTILRDK